ncbi:hypothetical protein AB4Y89_24480 [Terriglobus sp. 2YAB30_2]|uniref:hypothetical protein n=1 Tax=Terriglobus sp. 2YAB30_2 TaxID=3233023 RepID=UPI003F9A5B6C
MQQIYQRHNDRNKHYDKAEELFAEGFAAWLSGDEHFDAFVYGDARVAARLKAYYE